MTDQELVRRVAEGVMGWKLQYLTETDYPSGPHYKTEESYIPLDDWNPLTNLNHTFMVVERMRELGFLVKIGNVVYPVEGNEPDKIEYFAEFYKLYSIVDSLDFDNWPEVHNKNIGHAICEAALKAVRHG